MVDDADVREALRRQWTRIAAAIDKLDIEEKSRVAGWRNAEVLAHLAVQPLLLGRFLVSAETADATMGLEDNLAGTHAMAETIDATARQGAQAGKLDFARNATAVDSALTTADLNSTITSLQGPIRLADYFRTRSIEAVVHGGDLSPPVQPDADAPAVTVDALKTVLRTRAPQLADSVDLPAEMFVDIATGRASVPHALAHVMPLMT